MVLSVSKRYILLFTGIASASTTSTACEFMCIAHLKRLPDLLYEFFFSVLPCFFC